MLTGHGGYEDKLTGSRYFDFLEDAIPNFVGDLPLTELWNLWFQLDGPPQQKVSSVKQYLRDTFQQQIIGYVSCIEWSPRSPDLNPLDFFLWGYINQRVYATPPSTLQEL